MPTTVTLPNKFVEDENGSKFAPITTPNAVRFSDGTNLNDHLGDGMEPQKLTIRLTPPEGANASVLNGVPISIITSENTILYDGVWEGTDIELEIGTTYPVMFLIDSAFSDGYIPDMPEDSINLFLLARSISAMSNSSPFISTGILSKVPKSFLEFFQQMKIVSPNLAKFGEGAYAFFIFPLFNNEKTIEINYIDVQTGIATMYIDDTINNPESKITLSPFDAAIINAIKGKFHRYLGTYDNGILKMCKLSDISSRYFDDKTAADITGKMGNVFVNCEQPIYTRYSVDTSLGHNRHKIEISFANGGSGWKEWHFGFGQDRDVIGAFKLSTMPMAKNPQSITDYAPTSISDVSPTKVSYTDLVTLFQNSPFRMVSWGEHNIIAVLFYAMYGTTYSINALGITPSQSGNTPVLNGQYTDGVVDTTPPQKSSFTAFSMNFLGLENWIGNVSELIGNVGINISQVSGSSSYDFSIVVTERDGTTRNITFPDPMWEIHESFTGGGHTHSYDGIGYNTMVFPKMQFGQNLDVVAATDAKDYRYDDNDDYYELAYNDEQRIPIKSNVVLTIDGVPNDTISLIEIPYTVLYQYPLVITRTSDTYRSNGSGSTSISNILGTINSSSAGVSSLCCNPTRIDFTMTDEQTQTQTTQTQISQFYSRMCYTGTTQLITDPQEYIALFGNE